MAADPTEVAQRREVVRNWAVVGGVVALVAAVVVAIPPNPEPRRATSPDGSWAVEVFGSHCETTGFRAGKYEMMASVLDSNGRVVETVRVSLADSREAAERDYPITFDGNATAHIGTARTLRKADFIR